jgi:SNF2 family DNA or RNA helicase
MPDPQETKPQDNIYGKLLEIRKSKTCSLRPTPMLKNEIVGISGKAEPFRLRYYQVQGILHLLMVKRMVLGDGTGLGKTVEMIGALCYFWEKYPDRKVIVVSPKSAIRQWASEFDKFTTGVKTYVVSGNPKERAEVYDAWSNHKGPDKAVLILNYHSLVKDWSAGSVQPLLPNGQPDPKKPVTPGLLDRLTNKEKDLITIYDEATAFKNTGTKTWQVCSFLSVRSDRVYGLTATLLKNNLIEGFAIYKVVHPTVFTTKSRFLNDFCVTKLQAVSRTRKIPIVVGYKNLQQFRERIDPYFLGRPKHQVSDELPKLITKEITCELSQAEDIKYSEALTGVLQLGDGEVRDFEEHKAFVALIYCQQIVNSLALLKFEGGAAIETDAFRDETVEVKSLGAKEQALVDLFEGDLEGEKTIVYTRFSSLVPRLQKILEDRNIKSVAITGDVVDTAKNPARQKAKEAFQDMESGVQVIFITDAGSEAINLQAAAAMIFFDAPWSWGNYVQLLGRPIRIGSPHQHVVAYHIISERPRERKTSRKTIDHYTLELLQKKKDLIDKVLGEAAVGALDFSNNSFTRELVQSLQSNVIEEPAV